MKKPFWLRSHGKGRPMVHVSSLHTWRATAMVAAFALVMTNIARPTDLRAAGLIGDLDGDGRVGITDLSILLTNWGKASDVQPTTTPMPGFSPLITPDPSRGNSGESMPAVAPSGWKRVFSDDFTTAAPLGSFLTNAAYKGRWAGYDGFNDTSKNGTYSSAKTLSVADGLLDIYLHSEGNTHYVAAPTANGYAGQTYGRYSVRFKADPVKGYKTAWLLWPSSDQWSDGEIDFPEGDLDGTIAAFSHCVGNPGANCFSATSGARYTDWHTATTEWAKGRVTWFLDGKQIGTGTTGVPSKPMRWTLQTETSLGGAAPASSASGHVKIDWVTIDALQ